MTGVQEYNINGFGTFETRNKVPLAKGWKDRIPDPFTPAAKEFGVVLTDEHLVVDIDVKNNAQGEASWVSLCSIIGTDADPQTFTVASPSGGRHLYFTKPKDFKLRTKLKKFPGIDFITKGHPITGAGSVTDKGTYIQSSDTDDIIPAPAELISMLIRPHVEAPDVDPAIAYHDTAYNKERLEESIKILGAVPAGERNLKTYTTACRARDYGLSPAKAFEIMREQFIPNCEGELSEQELQTCVTSAYNNPSAVQGSLCPEKMFTAVKKVEKDSGLVYARMEFDRTDKGAYTTTLRNAINLIRGRGEISSMIKFNRFSQRIELAGVVPWQNARSGNSNVFDDGDCVQLSYYLASHFKVDFPVDKLRLAVLQVAMLQGYHPVYDYLDGLVWDGKLRVGKWLSRYMNAKDSIATMAMGRCALIGAVARIYSPGCKHDHMLVLEGGQSIGKSTACAILGGEWFSDATFDPAKTDGIQVLQGRWIVEVPEMSLFDSGATQNQIKKFLTTQTDSGRFAYGAYVKDYPRQCSFIGTFNPQHGQGYLKDDTGNRRYHPVRCGSYIDTAGLQRDRDQLWAEAVHLYKAGAKWHPTDASEIKSINEEIRLREVGDPWLDLVRDYVIDNKVKVTTLRQIYEGAIGRMAGNMNRGEQARIAKILGSLGYTRTEGRTSLTGDRSCKYRLTDAAKLTGEQPAEADLTL